MCQTRVRYAHQYFSFVSLKKRGILIAQTKLIEIGIPTMFIFIIFFMCTTYYCTMADQYPYKALVVVPVADLVGQPMRIAYPSYSAEYAYKNIPLCGGNQNRWLACPRIEQLLFNEIVEVLERIDKEIKVRVSHAYFIAGQNTTKQTDYWTHADSVIPLNTLSSKNIDLRMIPTPLDFNKTKQNNYATVGLLQPYYDSDTKLYFSAGTRFICAKTLAHKPYIQVFAYNNHTQTIKKIKIPKKICVFYNKNRTHQEMRILCVQIARQWTQVAQGFIPYVWGGCSVVYPYQGPFDEKTIELKHKPISFFAYPQSNHTPHTGLDCAGLVARAAQLAGIPYFYKNTHTLAHYMAPLQQHEHLQIGDLIWTPGHVMIVSDLKNNLLIEARSYFQGYGKVHEIKLGDVFKNINTYTDLEHCFFNKKPIERIDNQKNVRNTLPHFLLLNLESVWNNR